MKRFIGLLLLALSCTGFGLTTLDLAENSPPLSFVEDSHDAIESVVAVDLSDIVLDKETGDALLVPDFDVGESPLVYISEATAMLPAHITGEPLEIRKPPTYLIHDIKEASANRAYKRARDAL